MRRIVELRSERGIAAVVVIGVFTVLLLFVGFSTDLGIVLRYRRAMQNACDAGALAGAGELRTNVPGAVPMAIRYAETDMRQNYIAWDPSRLTATLLPDGVHPDRQVRVEAHADVPLFFLRPLRDSLHVAVACAARLTPVILTRGLVPLGLNYDAWAPLYDPTTGAPCASYIEDNVPLASRPAPCNAFAITLSVSASSNPWGSGNTGMISMSSTSDCFNCPIGAREWHDAFVDGSHQAYCYDPNHTAAVSDYTLNSQQCANVMTRPGTVSGPVRTAVDARCDSGNPLDRIIMMPLLNPAYTTSGSGRYTVEIWGFTAFELDCTNRPTAGAGRVSIFGGFVSITSYRATGTTTPFDTGVYAIRLVE